MEEEKTTEAKGRAICHYCDRAIIWDEEGGYWADPEATGDDSIWRETCDSNDTIEARHEPTEGGEE